MKWYTYRQSKSGGSFDHDETAGIGPCVFIQATDADHANLRAKQIGLYFNGCDTGQDCECCGDRWHPQWGDGDTSPMPYEKKMRPAKDGEAPWLYQGLPSYTHPFDGPFSAAVMAE